eukprot:scaffold61878_cov20-Tisochrysis_lutea.AAC.2
MEMSWCHIVLACAQNEVVLRPACVERRMRRCHIEQVVATGSSEAVAVLRLAWEAGMLLPLQQVGTAVAQLEPPGSIARSESKLCAL